MTKFDPFRNLFVCTARVTFLEKARRESERMARDDKCCRQGRGVATVRVVTC